MKSNLYSMTMLAGLLFLLVLSCSPYPNSSQTPKIQIVDVTVEKDSIPESEQQPNPETTPTLNLPSDHLRLTAYKQNPYILPITCNVKYEVIVPEGIEWLQIETSDEVRQARMVVFDSKEEKHLLLSIVQNPK